MSGAWRRRPFIFILLAVSLLAPVALAFVAWQAALPRLHADATPRPSLPAPPTLVISLPRSGDGVAGTLRLAGTAFANASEIAGVDFRLDHDTWRSAALDAPGARLSTWGADLPLGETAAGVHVLSVRARDETSTSIVHEIPIAVGASRAPPSLSLLLPANGNAARRGDSLVLTGTVLASQPIDDVSVDVDDGTFETPAVFMAGSTASPWSVSLPTNVLADGLHVARVVARDRLGGRDGTSAPVLFHFATSAVATPPVVRIVSPQDGAGVSTELGDPFCEAVSPCLRLAGTVADPSGVADGLLVAEDDAYSLSLSELPAARFMRAPGSEMFSFEWPLARAYAGEHRFAIRATSNVTPATPTTVLRLAFASPRALDLDASAVRAPTFTDLAILPRLAEPLAHVAWRVDGEPAGSASPLGVSFAVPGGHDVEASALDVDGEPARALLVLVASDRPPVAALDPVGPLATHVAEAFDAADSTDRDGNVTAWRFDFGDGGNWTSSPRATHVFVSPGAASLALTVRDDRGVESDRLVVPLTIADAPPLPDFVVGPANITELVDATFRDRSVDPDGEPIVARSWDFGDGTGASDLANVTHRYSARGDFTARLTVGDPEGASATVKKLVHVENVPPTANFTASPLPARARDPIRFTALTSKPDGAVVAWAWNFGDGSSASGRAPLHSFDAPGLYPVRLVVTDDFGATTAVARTLAVLDAPPYVNATSTPATPSTLDEISFLGFAKDLDGNVTAVRWDFGDGTMANTTHATHRYVRPGLFVVRFRATDDGGLFDEVSLLVRVSDAPPVVRLVPPDTRVLAGAPATLFAKASDADGRIVSYEWFVGDARAPVASTDAPAFTYAFPHEGTWRVRVVAIDDGNLTANDSLDLEAYPPAGVGRPPLLAIDFPIPNATVRDVVRFAGSATSGSDVTGVAFQLRDGAFVVAPGADPWEKTLGREHWYIDFDTRGVPNGLYDVVFRATDAHGAIAEKTVPLRVANVNASDLDALVLAIFSPAANDTLSGAATFRGAAYHPDGVEAVRARVDDGAWSAVQGAPGRWSLSLDTTALSNGPHVLTVRAFRGADLWRERRVPFDTENVRPRLVLVHPFPSRVMGVLTIDGTVADASPASVRFRVDQGLWQDAQGLSDWTAIVDTRALDNGTHTLVIRATGENGLDGTPFVGSFEVANVPVGDVVSPEAQAVATREHAVPGPSASLDVFAVFGLALLVARRGRQI